MCSGQDGQESRGREAERPRSGKETCSVVLGSQVETYFQVERMISCAVLLVSELKTQAVALGTWWPLTWIQRSGDWQVQAGQSCIVSRCYEDPSHNGEKRTGSAWKRKRDRERLFKIENK